MKNVDNLREVIKSCKEEMVQLSATATIECVDKFIEDVSEQIQVMYETSRGICFAEAKQIGISITNVINLENKIVFSGLENWILFGEETFSETHDMLTFWEFLDRYPSAEVKGETVAGYEGLDNICELRFLVYELEIRGFECYVDVGNNALIAAFKI